MNVASSSLGTALCAWVLASASLLALGCKGNPPPAEPTRPSSAVLPTKPTRGSAPPALRGKELARVPAVTYGPYLGMRDDGGLLVWAQKFGLERRFEVVPLSGRGDALAPAASAGPAPEEIGLVAVRPLGPGYAIVHTRRGATGEMLEVTCLDARGVPQATPTTLGVLGGRALWVEAVPRGSGALVFFAVRDKDGKRAEVFTQPVDDKCNAGNKTSVAKEAQAWQVQKLGSRSLLAVVRAAAAGTGGSVMAFSLDESGKVEASSTVSAEPTADLDLDAVAVGDRVVLGWTNRRALDPHVETALIDGLGKVVRAPERLTAPDGEQGLVRLVPALAGGTQAFVAWERVLARDEGRRRIVVSRLSAEGRAEGPRAELEFAGVDGGVPEFQAGKRGLLAMTLAPLCRRGANCAESDLAPTYVEFDERMQLVASEPLRLEALGGARADLGFGMGCTKDGCFAIAALSRLPAPVFVTPLEPRSNAWRPPLLTMPGSDAPPFVSEHETLARVESVAALASASAAGQEYLAYVTDFDPTTPWKKLDRPASDGRLEPLRARVALERVGSAARPTEPVKASPISLRAESLGGVSVVAGDPARDELLVAWAGLDAGTPQVFLTLVGKGGVKVSQRMLTRRKGELGDVCAVWVGDGWLLAWVDERLGDAAVFAAKVDPRLNRISQEQQISSSAAVVSDLSLAYDGKLARVAWADSRRTDVPGHSDIYTALVRPRDAVREGDERAAAFTRAHSFGPSLRAFSGGFTLAWLEREEAGEAGHVALLALTADGKPSEPQHLATPGEPRALGLDCNEAVCRVAVLTHAGDDVSLSAASFRAPGSPVEFKRLLELGAATAAEVRPVIRGDDILYADAFRSGARIRRARVKW